MPAPPKAHPVNNPAPTRQRVLEFLSPDLRDILFYIKVDSNTPQWATTPAYGAAYHDTTAFPNHKFVFSEPASGEDGDRGWRNWYFAAERADQDNYNYEISYPVGGSTSFPRYTRTYILPRAGYTPAASQSADPVHSSALLVNEEEKRIPGKLDSIFIQVVRTYDTFPNLSNSGDLIELEKRGFTIEYPWAQISAPRVTWKIPQTVTQYVTHELALGAACVIPNFTGIKLINQKFVPAKDGTADFGDAVRIYEPIPTPSLTGVDYRNDTVVPPAKFIPSLTHTIVSEIDPTSTAVDTGATVVESKVDPEDTERRKKTTVTATYGTVTALAGDEKEVPGQATPDKFVSAREITVAESRVAPGASADAGLLASRVEPVNTGHSVKTNKTLTSETVSALAGDEKSIPGQPTPDKFVSAREIIIAESRVAPGSSADGSILKSRVEPVNTQHSVKTNETIASETVASIGGKILDQRAIEAPSKFVAATNISIDESRVSPGTAADTGATILKSEVDPVNTFHSVKKTETLVSQTLDDLSGEDFRQDGLLVPEKFVDSVDLLIAESRVDPGAPADNGASILRSEVQPVNPSHSFKRTISIVSQTPSSLAGWELDMETGLLSPITHEVVAAGASGSAVGSDGTFSVVEPLNTRWSIKTTRKSTTLESLTWHDNIPHHWPAVLGSIEMLPVTLNGFVKRVIVTPIWTQYAYDDICQADFEETWTKTAASADAITTLRATPVVYQGVFFNVGIPPCLHGEYVFSETSGTDNPLYDFFTNSQTVPATNETDWPDTVSFSRTTPYKGGFKKRLVTVYKPNT